MTEAEPIRVAIRIAEPLAVARPVPTVPVVQRGILRTVFHGVEWLFGLACVVAGLAILSAGDGRCGKVQILAAAGILPACICRKPALNLVLTTHYFGTNLIMIQAFGLEQTIPEYTALPIMVQAG